MSFAVCRRRSFPRFYHYLYQRRKILFLGDSIYANIYSNKRNYTTQSTIQFLDTIDQFDAEIYVFSHWKPTSKDEYQNEAILLRTVATLTDQYKGRFKDIKKSYQLKLNREINDNCGHFIKLETMPFLLYNGSFSK
ncbi:hypothetical protein [Peribacillus simplex]|uniref:hypothetical protein n=1 Tax=Peribacillus TaxID=2675229 RepID=UPI0036DD74EB